MDSRVAPTRMDLVLILSFGHWRNAVSTQKEARAIITFHFYFSPKLCKVMTQIDEGERECEL